MRTFEDEVNEILIHYHDVARAHGMDRALREAVESNVFTRRECAGLRRRVEELEAERDALKARLADIFGHKWRPSERTTPSGKILYECEVCGLEDPAPVKVEFESRPCWSAYKWLRARLAEAEAQAAEVAHVLGLTASLLRQCRLYKGYDHGPALQPAVDIVLRQADRVVASPAGRETADRLRLLEEIAEAATVFTARCTLVECLPRTEDAICDEDPCLRQRLKVAVRALKGGRGDAGTKA